MNNDYLIDTSTSKNTFIFLNSIIVAREKILKSIIGMVRAPNKKKDIVVIVL
jgi:hypothetical protein